jgi:GNAT superfamily N-acetyltransferase
MTDLFQSQARAAREAYAAGLHVPLDALDNGQLTIIDRPEHAVWATALAVTFGTGTVLSIDPAYRQFVEDHLPEKHYRAMSGSFLQSITAEGERRGVKLLWFPPSLCFVLASQPPDLPVPAGFELCEHDSAWMSAEQANQRFENGVGEPGRDGREFRNKFALALYDERGEAAAVAGAFDTYGMHEIGVDVVRGHRGKGLGRLVVSAMAREILRRGDVPFYGCAATNIRSQRTAASCGFQIVCADATVSGPV